CLLSENLQQDCSHFIKRQIGTLLELSAKEGLLLWCQRKTSPYKNVNVQNFHMSWKDGLAFCALIHRHRPDLIDFAKLSRDNPLHNLNYAFDVAEKHLDIPRMLDPEDMVNTVRPDERSVMTYVSAYYHAFAGANKAESATSRISKVLRACQDNEQMMEQYERLASDLLAWIKQKIDFVKDRTTDGTIPGTCAKLDTYRSYCRDEKPFKLDEKVTLENLYNTLQTRLRLSNRPNFLPAEGHMIADIQSAWQQLENYEKGFEEWLLAEIKRLEQIEHLARKFRLKCGIHEAWSYGKAAELEKRDYEGASLSSLRAMAQKHDAFEVDLGSHQDRVERIVAIAEELNELGYADVDSVNARTQQIASEWDRLGQLSQQRRHEIHKILDVLNQLDQLHLSFAKRVAPFNTWLEQAQEDLQDMFIVNKVEDITALISGHENFKRTLPSAEKEMRAMLDEARQVQDIVRQHQLSPEWITNPYTMVNFQTLESRWQAMLSLIEVRDRELQTELARQEEHEQLRRQFAQLANRAGPYLERMLDSVHALLSATNMALEDQLQRLQRLEEEVQEWHVNMVDLERWAQKVDEARIIHNPHTRYTMGTLRVGWEQLRTNLKRAQNEIENQILTRDSRGVSEKQIEECRRCFNHFDRQRTRRLEPLDFRACLLSLGYNIPNTKQGEADFRRILKSVDPNGTGFVTFDSFMNFMTDQSREGDSVEQMIDSFRMLADDSPYITAEQLRRELPPEEADYCINRMKAYTSPGAPGDEALDYTQFATELYGESEL
ncbi:unnamed protein product, partial [Dicrocoelium dendriticum]